jgi:hypothetical protein
MRPPVLALATLCAALSGCATAPAGEAIQGTQDAPGPTAASRPAPFSASPGDLLEERHRARAQSYARDSNWADALVHWELLALLRPNSQEYRNAVAETRARISAQAATLMQFAEQARKQGNLDQAELGFVRVLNVDRENTVAAQALRDIEAERTRRAYSNRPPRVRMQ